MAREPMGFKEHLLVAVYTVLWGSTLVATTAKLGFNQPFLIWWAGSAGVIALLFSLWSLIRWLGGGLNKMKPPQ